MVIFIAFLKAIAGSMVVERLITGDMVYQTLNIHEYDGKPKMNRSTRFKCNETRETFYFSGKNNSTNCYGTAECKRVTGQFDWMNYFKIEYMTCLLYTSPSPRDS